VNQALYRRYRPEAFSEVIGQEHVTEPLMQALRTGRVSHAYLFSGPRGCGKTTCARILARCLNCQQGPTPEPCGECASCQELGRGGSGSLDVVEIDAASHGGVDDTRDLREKALFAPARDRYKVFVLDEAHMVSREGFNALLKIVEEPPPHVKFIFATTEPNKVLPTIRSRSHHYPFRLVPPGLMTSYMEQLAKTEGVEIAPGVMQMVVRAGGGSVRDTESVLDQLIGGSVDGRVTYERASSLLGFTPDELIGQMVAALDRGDGASMFSVVESVVESGLEPHRFAEDLLERLRDLIVLAAAGPSARQALRGLPEDQVAALADQAGRFGLNRLTGTADSVSSGLATMAGATSPRLHLELLAARALQAARTSAPPVGPGSPFPAPDAARAVPAPGARPSPAASPGAAARQRTAPAPPPQGAPAPPAERPAERPAEPRPPAKSASEWAVPGVSTGPAASPPRQFVDWDEPDAQPSGRPQPRGGAAGGDRPARQWQPPDGNSRPPTPGPDGLAPQARRGDDEQWRQLLGRVRQLSATAFGLVNHSAEMVGLESGRLTLAFATPDLAEVFNRRFLPTVAEAATQVFGGPIQVQAIVGVQQAPPGRRQPAEPGPPPGRADSPKPPAATAAAAGAPAPNSPRTAPAGRPADPPRPLPNSDRELPRGQDNPEDEPMMDDAGVRGLTGVPLVMEVLGGEIVEETEGG
jgi:DNA polymerase-3 subunit gamma/tau